MNNMKEQDSLAINLYNLRRYKKLSLEKVAEIIGVSRQTVGKWESGESIPDIIHCDALAALYDVTLDNLVHFDQEREGMGLPPKGKHLFGTVQIGERGQIVIPKKARDMLNYKYGDTLVVLGDTNADIAGIALVASDVFLTMANYLDNRPEGKEEES